MRTGLDPRKHTRAGLAGVALALALALRPTTVERAAGGLDLESVISTREPGRSSPRRWHVVDGTQWQLDAPGGEDMTPGSPSDDETANQGSCPAGMVEAHGAMKRDGPQGTVESLQTLACSEWVDHPEAHSCNAFDPVKWEALSAGLPATPMHFCIDRYEFPDHAGEYPVIMVSWFEAQAHCAARGLRLCTEDEFTFACEGPEARPYANGFARDARACVIDHPWRIVDFPLFAERTGLRIQLEIDALWQGEPTGSHRGCVSPFGAYDLTGNVDEWTVSSRGEGLRSILKGGYWGTVHARCRSSTRVHNEWFYFYQIGFRCCSDVPPADDAGADASPDLSAEDAQ